MIRKFNLPDNGIPIRVGDLSFIYKDVYHPIEWYGGEPYRPRVETLVLKDIGIDMLYMEKKGGNRYRIPGGSIDSDSSFEQQAENETNEEALLRVSDISFANVTYYQEMDKNYIAKGGDSCVAYVGSITHVYTAYHSGVIDKSTIEEKDLDDEMAKNGRFYPIQDIFDILRVDHIKALINSGRIRDKKVESLLYKRLNRLMVEQPPSTIFETSVVAGQMETKYIYHGSTYDFDVFHPMSLDLGNADQEPGWSTFCFRDYTLAKRFALMRVIQKYLGGKKGPMYKCNWDLKKEKPYIHQSIYDEVLNAIQFEKYYVYTVDATSLKLGIGNDERFPEVTFREDNVTPYKKDLMYADKDSIREDIEIIKEAPDAYEKKQMDSIVNLNRGWVSCMLNRDYSGDSAVAKLTKAVSDGDLKPGDDVVAYMNNNGIQLRDISFIERLQDAKSVEEGFDLSEEFEETILLGDHKALYTSEKKEGDNVYSEDYVSPHERFQPVPQDVNTVHKAYLYELENNGDLTLMGYYHIFELGIMDEDGIYCPQKYLLQLFVHPSYRELGVGSVLTGYAIRYHKKHFSCPLVTEVPIEVWGVSGIQKWIRSFTTKGVLRTQTHVAVTLNNMDGVVTEGFSLDMYKKALVGKKVYHGSTDLYDILEPTGLDLGNALEAPGWSLYTWRNEENAHGWGTFQVIKALNQKLHFLSDWNCLYSHTLCVLDKDYDNLITAVVNSSARFLRYYVYQITVKDDMVIGLGHSSNTKNCVTIRTPHITYDNVKTCTVTPESIKKYCKVVTEEQMKTLARNAVNYRHSWIFMNHDVMYKFHDNYSDLKTLKNGLKTGELKPGDSVEDYLKSHGLSLKPVPINRRLMKQVVESCEQNLSNLSWYHAEVKRPGFNPKNVGGWDEELYSKTIDHAVKQAFMSAVANNKELLGEKKFSMHMYTAGEELSPIYLGAVTMYYYGLEDNGYVPKFDWEWEEQEDFDESFLDNLKEEVHPALMTNSMCLNLETSFYSNDIDPDIEVIEECELNPSMEGMCDTILEPIFIVCTFTGTLFGKVVTKIQNCKFSHSGISLDSDMKKIYTFNTHSRKTGGAGIESIDEYDNVSTGEPGDICVMCFFVPIPVKEKIKQVIEYVFSNMGKTRYAFGNLINILANRAVETKDSLKMVCSQFVDYCLKMANIDLTKKSSNLVSPNDLVNTPKNNPKVFVLFNGKNSEYNAKKMDTKVNHILRTREPGELNVVVESMIVVGEAISPNISFSKSSSDIKEIVRSMSEKEHFYVGADKDDQIWNEKNSFYKEVLLVDRKPAAFLMVFETSKRPGIGFIITGTHADYRRMGYNQILINRLKGSKLPERIKSLAWGFDKGNDASESLAKKMGFTKEGKPFQSGKTPLYLETESIQPTTERTSASIDTSIRWYWGEEKTPTSFTEAVNTLSELTLPDGFTLPEQGDFEQYRNSVELDEAMDSIPNDIMEGWVAAIMEATKDKKDKDGLPSLGKDDKTEDYSADAEDDEEGDQTTDSPDNEGETSDDTGTDDLDDGGTDYTSDADGGDTSDDTSGEGSEGEPSDIGSEQKTDTQNGNNGVKNYTLLTDFESLYRLASEISDTIEPIIMEKPIQNKVLTQVRSNLSAIKASIMNFITLHFKADDYAFNLYYYEVFIGLLSKNLEILEKNRKFSSENPKQKEKDKNKE